MDHEPVGGVEEKELGDGVGLVRVELADLRRDATGNEERGSVIATDEERLYKGVAKEVDGKTRLTCSGLGRNFCMFSRKVCEQ